MCGIVAKIKRQINDSQTSQEIMAMFELQKNRGLRGVGFISFDDELTDYQRRQEVKDIEKVLETNPARSIIFHHRMPTSTANYSDCAHPIMVSHKELKYDYYLIHNGVISNDAILRDEHLALGYEYITTVTTTIQTKNNKWADYEWNDSEALAIDVARFIEGKQDEIKSRGSIAFITAQVNKKTGKVLRIYFGRNTSPLDILYTTESLTLRSEGGTESIASNKLYSLTLSNWELESEDVQIGKVINTGHNLSTKWWESERNDNNYSAHDYDRDDQISRFMNRPAKHAVIDVESEEFSSQLTMWQEDKIKEIDDKIEILLGEQDNVKNDIEYYEEFYKDTNTTPYHERLKAIVDQIDKLEDEKDLIEQGVFGD